MGAVAGARCLPLDRGREDADDGRRSGCVSDRGRGAGAEGSDENKTLTVRCEI